MHLKIIALGDYSMQDSSIALRVAENIKESLEYLGAKVIINGKDLYFCINQIEDNDTIFILTVSSFNKEPGSITCIPIDDFKFYNKNFYYKNQINFIKLLQLSKKTIKAYIIGIEIFEIKYNSSLSKILAEKFEKICNDILSIIISLYKPPI